MSEATLDEVLRETLSDYRLTRGEKRIIAKLASRIANDEHQLALARSQAFKLLREELQDPKALEVVAWLEGVMKALQPPPIADTSSSSSEAFFSPDDACVHRIVRLFESAKTTVDVCVFTITDDRISNAIRAAHQRDVSIRIISDNDKSEDRGSDIEQLERHGVPVRVDRTEYHMHHKYAIFDRVRLLTGSYNWTRSAAANNEENFIVTSEKALLSQFQSSFNKLWRRLQ